MKEAVKLLANERKFDKLLAKGSTDERMADSSLSVASSTSGKQSEEGAKLNMKW